MNQVKYNPRDIKHIHDFVFQGFKKFLMIFSVILIYFLFIPLAMAETHYLPEDLEKQLHHEIRVGYTYLAYRFEDNFKDVIGDYYELRKIDDLYHQISYGTVDVFVIQSRQSLTTEEINAIVEFVKNGGGFVIVNRDDLSDSVTLLLKKLGFEKIQETRIGESINTLITKGREIKEHPVTIGVESLHGYIEGSWDYVYNYITAIEDSDEKAEIIITYPSIMVVKEEGDGRVVIVPDFVFEYMDLSHPRMMVNIIEWVAGYTPPGWEPDITSPCRKYQEEVEEYSSLKQEVESWKSKYNNLEREYNMISQELQNCKTELEKLKATKSGAATGIEGGSTGSIDFGQILVGIFLGLILALTITFFRKMKQK